MPRPQHMPRPRTVTGTTALTAVRGRWCRRGQAASCPSNTGRACPTPTGNARLARNARQPPVHWIAGRACPTPTGNARLARAKVGARHASPATHANRWFIGSRVGHARPLLAPRTRAIALWNRPTPCCEHQRGFGDTLFRGGRVQRRPTARPPVTQN